MDKCVILSDAVRMVNQLRDEAKKLKESHEDLQDKINELKPDFLPSPVPSPYPGPGQFFGGKMVSFMGYPGVPIWQFTPLAAVDTTQDHVLHSPVA
ncbi:hypothetical protein AgCh_028324 [Apium graveolens]